MRIQIIEPLLTGWASLLRRDQILVPFGTTKRASLVLPKLNVLLSVPVNSRSLPLVEVIFHLPRGGKILLLSFSHRLVIVKHKAIDPAGGAPGKLQDTVAGLFVCQVEITRQMKHHGQIFRRAKLQ